MSVDLNKMLSEIPDEGQPGLIEEQVETPAVPKTEKTGEEAPTQDGAEAGKPTEQPASNPDEPVPTPKENYRWAETRRKLREEREAREALEAKISALESARTQPTDSKPTVPEEFVDLFGDNPDAWSKFSAMTERQAQKIVDAKIAEIEKQRKDESRSQEKYQEIIQDEFERLGETTGKDFSDPSDSERNEILKFAMEYRPMNEFGNIDLQKAYDLYVKLNPPKKPSDERKKIASITKDTSPSVKGDSKGYRFGQGRTLDMDKILSEID